MAKADEVREGEGHGVPAATVLAACREIIDAMSTFAAYTELFSERIGSSEEERTVVEDVRTSVSRMVTVVRELQRVGQVSSADGNARSGTFCTAPVYDAEESESEGE